MASEVAQLQKQLSDYTASLFSEGILNEQFTVLRSLQDESNPKFVDEIVTLFFTDSDRLLNEIGVSLGQKDVDFKKLDPQVHQLRGSSSSVGAQKVQDLCIALRSCSDEKNVEGCITCLEQVKNEYSIFKSKLDALFKIEKQIIAAGGSIPK